MHDDLGTEVMLKENGHEQTVHIKEIHYYDGKVEIHGTEGERMILEDSHMVYVRTGS